MTDTPEKFEVAAAEKIVSDYDEDKADGFDNCDDPQMLQALRQACARIRELEDERNDYMSLAVKYCNELQNIERERVKVMGEF